MAGTNFSELLNATFDSGTIHFKYLEKFLKSLVEKLDLSEVSLEDKRKFISTKNDPMVKGMPSANSLKKGLCNEEINPVENLFDVLNLTKRVEALEISVEKLTSIVQTVITEQKKRDGEEVEEWSVEPAEEIKINQENISSETQHPEEPIPSKISFADQKPVDETPKGFKKCCSKNLNPSSSIESLTPPQFHPLESLPLLQSFSICPFERLEKACKKKFSQIKPEEKFANLCDLRELERHLKRQNDLIISSVNSNQLYLYQQICNIQKQIEQINNAVEDIFFACEQNEEKIDEAILSMNNFNAKIFCLKTNVKGLLVDSTEFKRELMELKEKHEEMNYSKADKSEVDDQFKAFWKMTESEMRKFVYIDDYFEVVDGIRMRASLSEETMKNFEENVKKSLNCVLVNLDEKLNKSDLKNFKALVGTLFDEFCNDLKILLFKVSQNASSAGAFESFKTDLNCIACDSKVSMNTTFPKLENSALRFKNKLTKVRVPKGSSRVARFCKGGVKSFFNEPKMKKKIQEFQVQFPPPSQQCFIISKDNTIFKADPLKCLLNSK